MVAESVNLRDWLEAHYLPMFELDHAPKTILQEALAPLCQGCCRLIWAA